MSFIKNIVELDRTDLPIAGGKGANLGALLQAGLPVPDGFVITTDGYRAFVEANHLDANLHRSLSLIHIDDTVSLKTAADEIQASYHSGQIPPALADDIRRAYLALPHPPAAVAVRSSATSEDLPELSFAGQQDTYLNIISEEALLHAVISCWASLWTERAIAYRLHNAISPVNLALAVVVQQMVQSEVSGVLFTANPLSGKRSETIIEATFGLGEVLVSGQVVPDHYVIEAASNRITNKTLGSKALNTQGRAGGGTVTVQQDQSRQQALSDEQIMALTRLGQQAVAHFGIPQDMEWAFSDGQMYVIQSRPITTLYPLPDKVDDEPLEVFLSFGVWQGMLDPYSPLGQDSFNNLVSGVAELFNVRIDSEEQRTLVAAGERLFMNVSGLLRNSIGRRVLKPFITSIDPVSGEIVNMLLNDPRFAEAGSLNLQNRFRLMRGFFPFLKNIVFYLLFPRRGRIRMQNIIDITYLQVKERCAQARNLTELVATINDPSTHKIKDLLPVLVAAVAAGQGIALQSLIRMAGAVDHGPELVMEITRGLPYNVTTEMDLALWETAQVLRAAPEIAANFINAEINDLIADYCKNKLPPTAQTAITHFLERYETRGVGEIDLGRPRWKEDPTPIFQALRSYMQIDEAQSPDVVFQRGVEKAQQAEKQLVTAFAAMPGGRFKARQARTMIKRVRELGGLRESPKFALVQRMGIFRQSLLAYGHKLVEQGVFNSADDIFFLHIAELRTLGNGEQRNWQAMVAERRSTYQRELHRKRIPRILLSDGTAFYDAVSSGEEDDMNTLTGSPVSAGCVEGVVHVVFDPHGAQLAPGEILVCPATDPAWTPLFLIAGGLVMEVGGMMTHGSVVAREYGIPAVVGVQNATQRLKNGQKVRLDGASGKITMR